MDKPEKIERLNPALVDKMIRTEDAISRGQAELRKQELLSDAAPRTTGGPGPLAKIRQALQRRLG